jgi:hypothetical protein
MKIHYITPFATDKNIGKEYNARIEELPDDCWICLRDGDTLFLTPNWGAQIEAIVERNKDSFQVISCVTNRLRGKHQLYNNTFSENGDISHHVNIANHLQENYFDEVQSTTSIAGLCMIFNKDTWKQCNFKEHSIHFDSQFCLDVKNKGGKIGIAKGLYLFHLYRWGQQDPKSYIKHLTL